VRYLEGLGVADRVSPDGVDLDGLQLVPVPFVPEVRLYLAEDVTAYRARMEASAYRTVVGPFWPPFWASAWAGGQALARYVLDHFELVAGRRVLDVCSGSGLVAIAAAMAGAATVVANDVDRYALAAIALNANANGVPVEPCYGDLLGGDGGDAEVVLAGDVFYSPFMIRRLGAFLDRAASRGARVLVGDPGRGGLTHDWLDVVMRYRVSMLGAPEDVNIEWCQVLQPHGQRTRLPASPAPTPQTRS